MSKILFNISNHPAFDRKTGEPTWSEAQMKAAEKYGEIVDVPFPSVSASETISGIHEMTESLIAKAQEIYLEKGGEIESFSRDVTIMAQGEARLERSLHEHAEKKGIQTIGAGSDFASHKEIDKDGNEITVKGFEFKTFREINEPGAEPPKPLDLKKEMEISRAKFREADDRAISFFKSVTGERPESLAAEFLTDMSFPTKQEMASAISELKAELGQHDLSKDQERQMTSIFQDLEKYGMQVSQGPAFVNAANFPSTRWSDEQKRDAAEYGMVIDLKTPPIPGSASHEEAKALAHSVARDVIMMGAADVLLGNTVTPNVTAMVTWESSAKNMAISELEANSVQPVAICSERNTVIQPDGTRAQRTVYEGFQNIVNSQNLDKELAREQALSQEPEMTPWQAAVISAELTDYGEFINKMANRAFDYYTEEEGWDLTNEEAAEQVAAEFDRPFAEVRDTVNKLLAGKITRQEAEAALSSSELIGPDYQEGEIFQNLKDYLTQPEPLLQKSLGEVRESLINAMDAAERIEEAAAVSYAKGYINGERGMDKIGTISGQTDRIYNISKTAHVIQNAIDNGDFEAGNVTFSDIVERGEELTQECYKDLDMQDLADPGRREELGLDTPERVAYNAYERSSGEEPDERDQKDQKDQEAEIGD